MQGTGCLTQLVPVKSGKQYLIRVRGRIVTNNNSPAAKMMVTAQWRLKDKQSWNIGKDNVAMLINPDSAGWCEAEFTATVPEASPFLFLMLSVYDQNPEDKACFDSAKVYGIFE